MSKSLVPVLVPEELGGGHMTLNVPVDATAEKVKKIVLEKINHKRTGATGPAAPVFDDRYYRLAKLPLGSTKVDPEEKGWPQPFVDDKNMLSQCSSRGEDNKVKMCFVVTLLVVPESERERLSVSSNPEKDGKPVGLQRATEMPSELVVSATGSVSVGSSSTSSSSSSSSINADTTPTSTAPRLPTQVTEELQALRRKLLRHERFRGSRDFASTREALIRWGTKEEGSKNGVVWVNQDERQNCLHCVQKFTFTRRKHHCRECGEVFCTDCLALTATAGYDKPQFVCTPCREKKASSLFVGRDSNSSHSTTTNTMDPHDLEDNASGCQGYLHKLQSSLIQGESFVQKYYCVKVMGGRAFLCAFETQAAQETGVDPSEQQPIFGAKTFPYARGCFPKVKSAFCLGVQFRGVEEPVVLAAPSEMDRGVWLATLSYMGAEQKDMVPFQKTNPKSVKEGYLDKMGKPEKINGWMVRYCVVLLNPHRLEYYEHSRDVAKGHRKRMLRLTQEVVLSALPAGHLGSPFSFSIQPEEGQRKLFSGADEADNDEWKTVIEEVCESEKFFAEELANEEKEIDPVLLATFSDPEIEQMEVEHRTEALERENQLQLVQDELNTLEAELEEAEDVVEQDEERLTVMMRILSKDQAFCAIQQQALLTLQQEIQKEEEHHKTLEEEAVRVSAQAEARAKDVKRMEMLLSERERHLIQREKSRDQKDRLLAHYEKTWNNG